MRIKLIITGVAAILAAGCQNPGIVQVSPNTYMLSREDHGGLEWANRVLLNEP